MAATDFKDYYSILGLQKSATADEIKKAYRKLARKYHPDMNPGNRQAETRFKEIGEAYEVLGDSDKRRKYDQFGQYWKQAGVGAPGRNPGANVDFGGFDFSQFSSFEEFINELLGRVGNSGSRSTGNWNYRTNTGGATGFSGFEDFAGYRDSASASSADTEGQISLTLSEAFSGSIKRLTLGSESIEVRIPPGAKPGSRIRVRGKGQVNPYNRQRGDLYLKVEIQSHQFFQFEGDNLICEVAIAPDEAVLGAQIDVPTPDGTVTINVPPGIRSGQSLRLRGKGWPQPKGGRTDQLVKIQIVAPKDISQVERECYEKIRASRSYDPRRNLQYVRL
ncbi:MAG: DnaJ domain-containing protein [Oscillatoria sp. SIO1A7]|nr:DnaJ domain-containing protein [Oscillatoria sp. SIO1A7]